MDLLTTKLMIPGSPGTFVERRDALRRLELSRETRLVLVSAPAGSGKTTLLSAWLRQQEGAAAWVLLEEADNDLERFLLYLLAALRGADPALDDGLSAQLRVRGALHVETFLTPLLNRLAQRQTPLTLVLDDYHVIRDLHVHAATEFFLEHLPPGVRLALGTRADPPFALRRLRARGQLQEVRADTLRFVRPEVQVLLNERYGLELSAELLEKLEQQTEGWVAGLQLAALSLGGRSNGAAKEAFVAGFSGRHRHLADYLFSEVLEQQPAELVRFLQRTAVLDRLTLTLCAAVVGEAIEPQRLRALEARNLFLLPLDEEGRWYRYHPLFAEFLRQRLQEAEPALVPELYRRASRWCEADGTLDEAVGYAVRAVDFQRVAQLTESVAHTLGVHWDNIQLIRYAQKIPPDVLLTFPRLLIYYAWALTNTGQLSALSAVMPLLEVSERYAEQPHTVRACVLAMRAYERLRALDAEGSAALCEAALAELGPIPGMPSDEERWLLVAATNLMAYGLSQTQPERAEALYPAAIVRSTAYGNLVGTLNSFARLGRLLHRLGKLGEAEATFERGLREQLRTAADTGGVVNAGELQVNYALLLYEWNRLEDAEAQLERARDLNRLSSFPPVRVLELQVAVLLALARRDVPEAEACLGELAELGETISPHNLLHRSIFETTAMSLRLRLAAALRAVLGAAAAEQRTALLGTVHRWTEAQGLSAEGWTPEDAAVPGREARYALLAALGMEQNRWRESLGLLLRLAEAAEVRGCLSDQIHYLVLAALAHPDRAVALETLGYALRLAEGAGYRRVFLDGGPALGDLLRELEGLQSSPYLRSLLAGFQPSPTRVSALALSDRQYLVLRLLAEGRSNKEIAKALGLSPNTVKWYLRDIYAALGVRSRGKAVTVAREHGLTH